jgi:predicted signal transduction protein with EAL and GGDEF domain
VIVLEGDYPDALLMTFAEAASRDIASPCQYGEHTLLVGGCIGVAAAACGTESGEQLLLNADIALYRAKAAGQSRIRMFHKAMQQPATQRAA